MENNNAPVHLRRQSPSDHDACFALAWGVGKTTDWWPPERHGTSGTRHTDLQTVHRRGHCIHSESDDWRGQSWKRERTYKSCESLVVRSWGGGRPYEERRKQISFQLLPLWVSGAISAGALDSSPVEAWILPSLIVCSAYQCLIKSSALPLSHFLY